MTKGAADYRSVAPFFIQYQSVNIYFSFVDCYYSNYIC